MGLNLLVADRWSTRATPALDLAMFADGASVSQILSLAYSDA